MYTRYSICVTKGPEAVLVFSGVGQHVKGLVSMVYQSCKSRSMFCFLRLPHSDSSSRFHGRLRQLVGMQAELDGPGAEGSGPTTARNIFKIGLRDQQPNLDSQ